MHSLNLYEYETGMGPKRQRSTAAVDSYSILVLGAPAGTVICGAGADTRDLDNLNLTPDAANAVSGVELLVAEGFCPALSKQPGKEAFRGRKDLLDHFRDTAPDRDPYEEWARTLAAHLSISVGLASAMIAQAENQQGPTARVLGLADAHRNQPVWLDQEQQGVQCKFKIMSLGAWTRNSEDGPEDTVLQQWADTGELVTGAQILKALDQIQKKYDGTGPGMWALSSDKWVRGGASRRVHGDDGTAIAIDVCALLGLPADQQLYDLAASAGAAYRVALPAPAAAAPAIAELPAIVAQAYIALRPSIEDQANWLDDAEAQAQAKRAVDFLNVPGVRAGALKSLFQKLTRVLTRTVRVPGGDLDVSIFVMASVALCFTPKGDSFLPDLQIFVRGHVASLKRVAVVLFEDAWPVAARVQAVGFPANTTSVDVAAALLASALASVRVAGYIPPPSVLGAALRIIGVAARAPSIVDWREAANANRDIRTEVVDPARARLSSRMLDVLKAFDGDLKMVRTIAARAESNNGALNVAFYPGAPHEVVPWYHLIDFHVYSGSGLAVWSMEADREPKVPGKPLKPRHVQIFDQCAGFNPRLTGSLLAERTETIKQVRAAQKLISHNVVPTYDTVELVGGASSQFQMAVDYGCMTGGTAPIAVTVETTAAEDERDQVGLTNGTTWKLVVILGAANERELVVLEPMKRGAIDDPRPQPSESAKTKAVVAAQQSSRPGGVPFSSPMLGGYSRVLHTTASGWTLRGAGVPDKVWRYADSGTPNTITVTRRSVDPPKWWSAEHPRESIAQALVSGATAHTAMRTRGPSDGVCADAKQIVETIFDLLEPRIRTRLLSMVRQRYLKISLPTPSRDGGQNSDEVAPIDGEWKCYKALLLMSRAVPGALRPVQVPDFSIPNARLLRVLESWLDALHTTPTDAAQKTLWTERLAALEPRFLPGGTMDVTDFPWQQQLVDQMVERDATAVVQTPAHFLRLATGGGKTIVSLWYAHKWLAATGGAKRIVFFTPTTNLDAIRFQLANKMGIAVNVWAKRTVPPDDATFILIAHEVWQRDPGRDELMAWIVPRAASTFFIVDEVHACYAATIRSSYMRRAVAAAPKMILATAIPPVMARGAPIAADWLRDAVGFPFLEKNSITACAQLVAAHVVEPWDSETRYISVTPTASQRREMVDLLKRDPSWNALAAQAREICYSKLVSLAVDLALHDRAAFPDGGVMLVVNDRDEQLKLVDMVRTLVAREPPPHRFRVEARGDTSELDRDNSVGILVVRTSQATGYDLPRFGAMVSGVYATSPARRIQLAGRLKRVATQRHTDLQFLTVYPEGTILELLLARHNSVDDKISSLDALAKKFAQKK